MLRIVHFVVLGVSLLPAISMATTLKIATIAPDGTSWMSEMRKGAEEIKARTDGRVSFRFYPGGIMGNDKSVLRKIRAGQLHGGAITGGGLAEVYPEANVYSCFAITKRSTMCASAWTRCCWRGSNSRISSASDSARVASPT
jgi:TRAP-type C4-dicarboxylate transport system substrate-binding protein